MDGDNTMDPGMNPAPAPMPEGEGETPKEGEMQA